MEYDTYMQKAMLAVATPVALTSITAFITNTDWSGDYPDFVNPSVFEYDFWEDTEYMVYVFVFFGALAAFLFSLMIYNISIMFGLDQQINHIQKGFLDWFTTPSNTVDERIALEAGWDPEASFLQNA